MNQNFAHKIKKFGCYSLFINQWLARSFKQIICSAILGYLRKERKVGNSRDEVHQAHLISFNSEFQQYHRIKFRFQSNGIRTDARSVYNVIRKSSRFEC